MKLNSRRGSSPTVITYYNPSRIMALGSFLLVVISSLILIRQESGYVKCSNSQGAKWTDYVNIVNNNNKYNNSSTTTVRQFAKQQSQHMNNQYSLSPGELPGYTGWSRPEQTLAGYFDIDPLSHSPTSNNQAQLLQSKYHSIVKSGDKFSLLLTCNHNNTVGVDNDIDEEPPYECPSTGGTLFYVRAYGPAVITGLVTDFHNASYSIEMQFIDPGEYFLEVVTTFSVPLDYDEFPLLDDDIFEPGYEGYMVGDFPITILVTPSVVMQDDSSLPSDEKDKPWCTISQLTETSPQSALYKGHWQVIDTVARLSHKPLTPDETQVSLDGYRMGLNSVGVRMSFEYEQCDLIHIRDIAGGLNGGLDKCLNDHLGFHIPQVSENSTQGDWESNELPDRAMISGDGAPTNQTNVYDENNFEGVHVIFIGDSVMRLVRYFFLRLVGGSIGFKVTLIETNGGIHATMSNVTSTLEAIRKREEGKRIKRAILFNSGLHDIDILCSSKRKSTREKIDVIGGKSCEDSYREAMTQLVHVLNEYPAILKVFRSTTAGWQKYGNYGFSWGSDMLQPQSRSTHLVYHFNTIVFDVIEKLGKNIYISDGYWLTLPRPDHTQTSTTNEVGKHLVHPGFEVLSVLARRWFMLILWGLCGSSFESCMTYLSSQSYSLQ